MVAQPLHLYLFPPGVKVLEIIEFIATFYSFTSRHEDCICTLELGLQLLKCNSFLSIYVILNKNGYVLHFIRVAL